MLNKTHLLFALTLLALGIFACDDSQTPDAGQADVALSTDVTLLADVVTSIDVETTDATLNAPDVVSAPDAGPVDLGPVQCRDNSDCQGENGSCNRTAPGGICLGCGGDCPSGTECQFGTCIRQCDVESDCTLGFQCLASGRCGLESCSGDNDCEGPYVCGANDTCERPSCDVQQDCPSPLVCESSRCVEPR